MCSLASPRKGMEPAVSAAGLRSSSSVVRPSSVVPRSTGHHQHLCLALARPAADGQYETLALNPGEPIRDLTMKLTNKGWYSGKSCIVFGDRELADAVRLSDLVAASGKATPAYLHVFVKLADVESVTMRTLMRELSLSNPAAAEQQLAATMMKAATTGQSLLALPCSTAPAAATGEQAAPAAAAEAAGAEEGAPTGSGSSRASPFAGVDSSAQDAFDSTTADRDSHGRAVVHLCIHKSAKVNWHHMSENRFELSISSSDTVDSLMRKIEAANGIALEPGTVLIDGQPLSAGQPLAAYGISKGITKLELVPHEPEGDDADALPDGSPSLASPAHGLHHHWQAARAGLAEGLAPTLAKAGTGGSYFLQDVSGRPVAVFKPEDEEPLAVNNPKGRIPGSDSSSSSSSSGRSSMSGSTSSGSSSKGSEGLRRGTKPGEGAVREVAAYVLDRAYGSFSGVPPTALVSAYVSGDAASGTAGAVKVGSLQQFIESEGDCEERGYSGFPVQEVHKIAVLDLRLGNADRNAGNILARRKADGTGGQSWELIPIDHGYCLPSSFEDISYEWAYWPQAEQPFNQATLEHIAALDADRDIATLAAHGITLRPECERVFRACTLTLQKGAAAGLTASQIAGILCRDGLTKSVIEKLHSNAMQLAKAGAAAGGGADRAAAVPQGAYLQRLGALLDEYLEEYLLECADLLY